uniref:Uncharacterized protein n=1 Tax=Romanomermis culicivorax TaxID=13658 RepID=A0A915HJ69_ROMCU
MSDKHRKRKKKEIRTKKNIRFLPYDVHYELCFCLISSQYSKGCYRGQIAVEKVKQRPQNAKPIEFQIIDYEVCSAKCNA